MRAGDEAPRTTFTATTALPYPHSAHATAGLRAQLRHHLRNAGRPGLPDWATLVVAGPVESTDHRGRTWFESVATVELRPAGPQRRPGVVEPDRWGDG